ncbi:hypothetical protein BB558_002933 [Smittium angustum]|uniref:Transcription factor domain-containing protein n=1 Tax=Smittium angustum TaxID=133377 RepID=A0A2U1J7F2_SMIAN|nr:hypothetical protein BB558_002933 [Smittium angustum]
MTSNQFEYSNSFFTDTIHGLPIPNRKKLKEMSLILPHVFPETMIPMRLPEFINKLTNKKYPFYFIFAVLAAGVKYIKTTRNGKDKELETKYATKSIELIRKETDISDPLIVWACIFIAIYTHSLRNLKLNQQFRDIAEMAVKKTKLYQLDLNKNLIKFKHGYTEDDMEFRRRVWWMYYFNITGYYIFNGNFITFEQRDVVVNLPKNDFKYRYGGSFEGCDDKELRLLNNIANDPSDENNPLDCHYLIVNTYSLYKNIATFVSKRWRKDGFDEDGANMRFVLYINQLHRLKDKIDETLGDGFVSIKEKYTEYKGTTKLLLETESHIVNHLLRCIYYSMLIYLYQSELVRDQDIKIRPERVKSAKQQCINASIKQMELMEWYSQNVPTEYQGFPHIAWSLNSLVSLTNFFLIQDPSLKEKHTDYFNRIVSVYKSFDKNSEVVDSLLMFVNAMTKIKTKASENNKKYIHLLEYMKPFGISEHDIEPWIIPKYGSFFHSHCCIIANFSTLDIGEYLGEVITTVSVFQNELYSEAYKDFLKKLNQHEKQEEKLPNGYLSQITRTILDLTKVSVYKSFDKNSEVVDSLLMFVNAMTKIKTKASENNKKYIHLLEYMKPFGISEHDIEPWIIPKYGSFFHSYCCIIANFSTLDIGEYLGGIITTVSVFQNELYSEAYKDFLKKLNQHEKQEEKLPNGYLSQITRTILDLTKGLHIKKSIVVDKGFDIEYFYHKKPLVFDSSLLIVNRSFPENKSKIKRTLKSTSLGGSCEHSTKIFNNKNIPKKSRKNKMRLEYLLNKN